MAWNDLPIDHDQDGVLRGVAGAQSVVAMLVDSSYLANPPLVPIEEDLGSAGNGDRARESGRVVTLWRSRICWHDALAGQASTLVERE